MIIKLTFTDEQSQGGYIKKKKTKTVLRKKYEGWSEEDIDADIAIRKKNHEYISRYERENRYYKEVSDGYENPQLVKNLLKRDFTFAPDKINILFGPNGSGKTTILKTIATYCLCGEDQCCDGFTNIINIKPPEYGYFFDDNKNKYSYDMFLNKLNKKTNRATIEWDGSPVYYENIAGRHQTGSIGDLAGPMFQSTGDEILYHINKGKISQGQHSIYLLNQLINVCKSIPTRDSYKETLETLKRKSPDVWFPCAKNGFDYINSFGDGNGRMTLLLDEIDKSMDMENILLLYKEFLPTLMNKYNLQIIIVSHSPLMLTNIIQDSDNYNFISIDKKYTKKMKKLFSGVKF